MWNLRQIGIWTVGSVMVVLILGVIQACTDRQFMLQGQEWGVFPKACLLVGESMLAAWFLGTALRKRKEMPPDLGQAGIGLILAGLTLSGALILGDLSHRF